MAMVFTTGGVTLCIAGIMLAYTACVERSWKQATMGTLSIIAGILAIATLGVK